MKSVGNSIVQKLGEPKIVDLPASSGTPLKIDMTGEMVASVTLYATSDFFWAVATTDTLGASKIASDDTRGKFPSGIYEFECSGNHSDNLYLVSTSASAVTDGISYNYNYFA